MGTLVLAAAIFKNGGFECRTRPNVTYLKSMTQKLCVLVQKRLVYVEKVFR